MELNINVVRGSDGTSLQILDNDDNGERICAQKYGGTRLISRCIHLRWTPRN